MRNSPPGEPVEPIAKGPIPFAGEIELGVPAPGSETDPKETARLISLGAVAGSVAHDIGNLLGDAPVALFMIRQALEGAHRALNELHLEGGLRPRMEPLLRSTREEAQAADTLLRRLESATEYLAELRTYVAGRVSQTPFEVRQLLETAVTRSRDVVRGRATLAVSVEGEPRAMGCPKAIRRILVGVVHNSVAAFERSGVGHQGRMILLEAGAQQNRIRVSVRDNGPGMEIEDTRHAFVLGRSDRKSSGIGLALARATIEEMGGGLSLSSAPGKGTSIHIDLPTPPPSSLPARDQSTTSSGARTAPEDPRLPGRPKARGDERKLEGRVG